MTNEELAIQIQLGKTEYYAELWERVRLLMYKLLNKRLYGVELPNYISREDMEQELYFAFCKAVDGYNDLKPYKFTSYLGFHTKNTVRDILAKCKTKESSYNQTAGDEDDTELIDLMADAEAEEAMLAIELTDLQKTVREAVAILPYNERQVITLFYFEKLNFKQISEFVGIEEKLVKKRKNKGILILRQNQKLKQLNQEFVSHYNGMDNYEWRWDYSKAKRKAVENIKQRQNQGEFLSYGKIQSLLMIAKENYIKEADDWWLGIFRR